jgi:nucleotidyltransferase substrate binding protein (TIGR01987 family)
MEKTDIRWKQRFNQFNKAFSLLASAIKVEKPSELERAGLIQFFEMSFELGWKLLKDYLENEGFDIKSPREAVKQAFQSEIIQDGNAWIMALEDRNLSTHTYQEQTALAVEQKIRQTYYPLLLQLQQHLNK